MKTWLTRIYDIIRTSFWFIPSIMAIFAVSVAVLMLYIDNNYELPSWLWVIGASRDTAEELLTAVLSSIITVLSLVFSVTVLILTMSSQQFGPRLLRNFIRDRVNQFTLGIFTATVVFCLTTLAVLGDFDIKPHMAVTMGVLLAFTSLGTLIFFIHHIATHIQAPRIVANVANELDILIGHLCKPDDSNAAKQDWQHNPPPDFAIVILSSHSDYIQAFNLSSLVKTAHKHDLTIWTCYRAGQFVINQTPLFKVYSPNGKLTDNSVKMIRADALFGHERTDTQDLEFEILQMVEVAVRALSPSINDPFTAMTCVERLGSAIHNIMGRALPQSLYYKDGKLRLIVRQPTFQGICDAAFNQIREHAAENAAVTIQLLNVLGGLVLYCHDLCQQTAIIKHISLVGENGMKLAQLPERSEVQKLMKAAEENAKNLAGA